MKFFRWYRYIIYWIKNWAFIVLCVFLYSCTKPEGKVGKTIFKKISSKETGLHFTNSIEENDTVNLIVNEYSYMGGGVGIGDFNNDGLQDIFFSANQVSSRLYINEGKNHFKDITEMAGVKTNKWCTGVSVIDINNDGWQDIYICVSGSYSSEHRRNLLYINNHNLTFTEQAADYGLADTSFSTQAAFLDYDKDGDLDMYLLNNQIGGTNPNNITSKDLTGKSIRSDRLYRNMGISKEKDHPFFVDVSVEAGIKEDGYGLGVVVCDVNNDNWPDIYVANDYISNDLLWLNNRNGSFTNVIASSINHQSYSSMGVDAADMNNDGRVDIITLDMMPGENERQKMMYSFLSYERYEMERRAGYEPEFMRNMLHLNNGNLNINDTLLPRFSEIGQLAGISQTDWSWSVLMADFDNDGWNDIHVTNGMGKDLINADFVMYRANHLRGNFNKPQQRWKELQEKLTGFGQVPLRNYLFKNNKDYTFNDVSEEAGINDLSISNGAAYADFDNDGDLDLVVNNINQEAFFYENLTNGEGVNHFLKISLKGDSLNADGIGTKIYVYSEGNIKYAEQNVVRGYLSSVDKRINFGIGLKNLIDSIKVIWPDDKMQIIKNVKTDTSLTLDHSSAEKKWIQSSPGSKPIFADVTNESGVSFLHRETYFNDFNFQRLLPQKFSQSGPFITIGDVNGDRLEDFFIGGAFNQSGKIFVQDKSGQFAGYDLEGDKKYFEDMGSAFFDTDGDNDLDLIVASGSTEFDEGSPYYAPRLYLNDGKGNFKMSQDAFSPAIKTSALCVTPGDYDNDGDMDVFIGGRVSLQFPHSPRSYLLQNNGGKFIDVTASVNEDLVMPGMITAAIWTHLDNDNYPDLIIAGEWMPIRLFLNKNGQLLEITASTGLEKNEGLWRSLTAADLDKDGDMDFVAGNLGSNNKYNADELHPMKLFYSDMDKNGSFDPLLCYYIVTKSGKRELLPGITLGQFSEQVPSIKKQFIYNADYAKAGIQSVLNETGIDGSSELTCFELKSCWFENKGNGKFEKHPLPSEAQFAPINAIVCEDFNKDNIIDILVAGNEYQADVMTGRYDASYGLLLKGNSNKIFSATALHESDFIMSGDCRDLKIINTSTSKKLIIGSSNNGKLKIFKEN